MLLDSPSDLQHLCPDPSQECYLEYLQGQVLLFHPSCHGHWHEHCHQPAEDTRLLLCMLHPWPAQLRLGFALLEPAGSVDNSLCVSRKARTLVHGQIRELKPNPHCRVSRLLSIVLLWRWRAQRCQQGGVVLESRETLISRSRGGSAVLACVIQGTDRFPGWLSGITCIIITLNDDNGFGKAQRWN